MARPPDPLVFLALAAAATAAVGCRTRTGGAVDPDPGRHFQVPNATSGATRGGGKPEPTGAFVAQDNAAAEAEAKAKADAEAAARAARAEALWNGAQAREATNPSSAADLYERLANDHKDSPHLHEALWRAVVTRERANEWNGVVRAVKAYMDAAPMNPHLTEIEEMTYRASVHVLERARGWRGVFRSDKEGFEGLQFLVDRVPEGRYADDALMALGDEYMRKDAYEDAALQFQSLLLRYPDSEWSFKARLRLGDAYLARDQGAEYHAGYVDLDPRVVANKAAVPSPAYLMGRPVRSCVAAALEQYEAFLERIELDPGRRVEYASDVQYATAKVAECRQRIADKDRVAAAFYGGRGASVAADAYRRYAANVENGVAWTEGLPPPPSTGSLPAAPPTPPPPPPAPPPAPPPSPPVVASPPPSPPATPPEAIPPGSRVPTYVPPATSPPAPPPTPPPATSAPPPPTSPPASSGGLPPPRYIPGGSASSPTRTP